MDWCGAPGSIASLAARSSSLSDRRCGGWLRQSWPRTSGHAIPRLEVLADEPATLRSVGGLIPQSEGRRALERSEDVRGAVGPACALHLVKTVVRGLQELRALGSIIRPHGDAVGAIELLGDGRQRFARPGGGGPGGLRVAL